MVFGSVVASDLRVLERVRDRDSGYFVQVLQLGIVLAFVYHF